MHRAVGRVLFILVLLHCFTKVEYVLLTKACSLYTDQRCLSSPSSPAPMLFLIHPIGTLSFPAPLPLRNWLSRNTSQAQWPLLHSERSSLLHFVRFEPMHLNSSTSCISASSREYLRTDPVFTLGLGHTPIAPDITHNLY